MSIAVQYGPANRPRTVLHSVAMKITVVAFDGCMTSTVFGQMDAFAIAAYIAARNANSSWSDHHVRLATSDGEPVQDTDYVRINKPRAGVGI